MKYFDVVIVGAGPAGLTAMKYLSSKYKTLLIDKNNEDDIKPCGGLLAEEATNFFKKENITIPDQILSKPGKPQQIYLDINNEVKITGDKLLNINRGKFKAWLLNKIDKRKIKFNTKLKEINKRENYNLLKLENNGKDYTVKTKLLVGASGAYSKSKRYFYKSKKYYMGIQSKLKMNYDLKNVYFLYNNKITNYYIWLVPKSNHTILGFGLKNNNFKKKFKKLEEIIKIYFGKFKQLDIRTHKITCPNRNEIFLGKDNILIIGEAAGLISPSSGEGISYALKSGYYCAKAINEDIDKCLSNYRKNIKNIKSDIDRKIAKRNVLKNPIKRKEYFNKRSG